MLNWRGIERNRRGKKKRRGGKLAEGREKRIGNGRVCYYFILQGLPCFDCSLHLLAGSVLFWGGGVLGWPLGAIHPNRSINVLNQNGTDHLARVFRGRRDLFG